VIFLVHKFQFGCNHSTKRFIVLTTQRIHSQQRYLEGQRWRVFGFLKLYGKFAGMLHLVLQIHS